MKYFGPPQSGSVSNLTYSRNRFGQYVRSRNGRGGAGNAALATIMGMWESASDSDRNTWNEGVNLVLSKGLSIGQGPLTAVNLFVKLQLTFHAQTGGYGPTDFPGFSWFDPLVNWGVINDFSVQWSGGLLLVTFTFPGSPAQGVFELRSSGIVTAGTMSPPGRGKWWKTFFTVAWTPATTQPVDLTAWWVSTFGSVPSSGQWTWFEAASNLQPALLGPRLRLRVQA